MVFRTIRILAVLLPIACTLCSAQSDPEPLRLVYTGKLFGYYRLEPGENPPGVLSPVKQFFEPTQITRRKNRLLLGMGDNFAPEFGAGVQLTHAQAPCPHLPEADPPIRDYKSDCRYAHFASDDNVAHFLLEAGYRAIVPGREDFIYSAVWLKTIAGLLHSSNATAQNPDKKLTMLAANLRVKFAPYSKTPKDNPLLAKVSDLCPLLFTPNLVTSTRETCVSSGVPALLDWLDRLDRLLYGKSAGSRVELIRQGTRISNTLSAANRAENIRTRQTYLANGTKAMLSMLPLDRGSDWDPIRTALSALAKADDAILALKQNVSTDENGRVQLCAVLSLAKTLVGAAPPGNTCLNQGFANIQSTLAASLPDLTNCASQKNVRDSWTGDLCAYAASLVQQYAVDAAYYAAQPEASYQGVTVDSPFNSDALKRGRDALLHSIAARQLEIGYTEATLQDENGDDSGTALIIGVVGQESMRAISPSNRAICVEVSPVAPHMIASEASGCGPDDVHSFKQRLEGTVKAVDPVRTVRAILRAAEVAHPGSYQYRILMAQMPHTEAEELAARLQHPQDPDDSVPVPELDLVLSEAQIDHTSVKLSLSYERPTGSSSWPVIPVLTAAPAYNSIAHELNPFESLAELTTTVSAASQQRVATNTPPAASSDTKANGGDTTVHLLMQAVHNVGVPFVLQDNGAPYLPAICDPDDPAFPANEEPCREAAIQFLLQHIQAAAHSDVAMLQRRDLFLEKLPANYIGYDPICHGNHRCELQVALDRILWKGDYYERVMLSGKDLAAVMSAAGKLNGDSQSLQAQDTFQQWLVTFGMVQPRQPNLTRLGLVSTEFSVMQDPSCADAKEAAHPSAGGDIMYCVNGQPLLADHAYALSTSDSLAEDDTIYSALSALPADYRETPRHFLTAKIADTISPPAHWLPRTLTAAELDQQKRGLFQIDIAKMVLGYNARVPRGGDAQVAKSFQGAADSRASAPYQSEIDVEAKTRISWNKITSFSFGAQSDLGYDRAVQGNLQGNPVNASYSPNQLTVGGFLEKDLGFLARHGKREPAEKNLSAGKTKLVLAPFQYKRQIVGSYLIFPHTTAGDKQQLSRQLPLVTGFSHRAGIRWEAFSSRNKWYPFDRGTYIEAGAQLSIQNNVLSSVTLSTGSSSLTCPKPTDPTQTISNCSAGFPVTSATTLSPLFKTLHAPGFYWDVHLQRALTDLADKSGPGISVIVETQGDAFFRRPLGKALATQTLYDAPLSIALSFPVLRNLSLAPTYSPFFYGSQITAQHLWVNSFGINVRWYLDRDAAVRGLHQVTFKGPASADETKSAKSAK